MLGGMTQQSGMRFGIAGTGRLGGALAVGLHTAGYEVVAVSSRRLDAAEAISMLTGAAAETSPQAVADVADVVLITTADGVVAEVCSGIRWRPGQAAVHCSGVLSLDALAAAREAGALAGCLHPLQSFPRGAADAGRFLGITFGVEGDGDLGGRLEAVARALGANVVRLDGVDRALYHASAILASNDVVALAAAATRAWTLAGLPREAARAALGPLLLGVAGNVAKRELTEALTGPLARGDIGTVERHLVALSADPALQDLYRRLAGELLRLPLGHTSEVSERLYALLDAPDT